MEREKGLYWCKLYGEWTVCEYFSNTKDWYAMGDDRSLYDSSFEEIDEKKIIHE